MAHQKLAENGFGYDMDMPVSYHADGPIGAAVSNMGDDALMDFDGEPLGDVLGKVATDVVRARRTPDQGIAAFKAIRDRLPPSARARRVLDMAIQDMGAPQTSAPTLPASAPEPLRKLAEDLHSVPLVRRDPGKEEEALLAIANDIATGRLRGARAVQAVRALANRRHESLGDSGKFQIDTAVLTAVKALEQLQTEERELRHRDPQPIPAVETLAAAGVRREEYVRKRAAYLDKLDHDTKEGRLLSSEARQRAEQPVDLSAMREQAGRAPASRQARVDEGAKPGATPAAPAPSKSESPSVEDLVKTRNAWGDEVAYDPATGAAYRYWNDGAAPDRLPERGPAAIGARLLHMRQQIDTNIESVSREDAAELLDGLSKNDLHEVAQEIGTELGTARTKPEIARMIVESAVGAKLDFTAMTRGAEQDRQIAAQRTSGPGNLSVGSGEIVDIASALAEAKDMAACAAAEFEDAEAEEQRAAADAQRVERFGNCIIALEFPERVQQIAGELKESNQPRLKAARDRKAAAEVRRGQAERLVAVLEKHASMQQLSAEVGGMAGKKAYGN
jgi:hypothetical protein